MKKEQKGKAVLLPAELYSQIEERVKATGFSGADDYVIFVLEQVLKEDEASGQEDEAEVKRRLKALGYMD